MQRLRPRADDDHGFTLIELLVVVIIIGILAAIAIPVYLNQRQQARDGAVKSDLRNASTAQVAYLIDDRDAYTDDVGVLAGTVKFGPSAGVTFDEIRVKGGDRFCMVAHHDQGSAHFYFDSDEPHPQKAAGGASHCSNLAGATWDP